MSSSLRALAGGAFAAGVVAALVISPLVAPQASATIFVKSLIGIPPTTRDASPVDVGIDRERNQAYVVNEVAGTVTVIDTRLNTPIATIPHAPMSIGSDPTSVAIDPVHDQVYVTNFSDNSVSVIDATTNVVRTVISENPTTGVGRHPAAVAVDPSLNRAYVVNQQDATVSVIATDTNVLTTTISVGSSPYGIAIDTHLHRGYITNPGDNTVTAVDTATNAVMSVLPFDSNRGIGKYPDMIAVDSDRHRAFVVNINGDSVSVIDTANNSVIKVLTRDDSHGIGYRPFGVGVDTASGQTYVASDAQITAINTSTLAVTRVIRSSSQDYGTGLQGIGMDPDHHQALVTGYKSNTVAVLDLDSTAPLARRGGADRFEVSVANSVSEYAPGIDVAYVASGNAFADALSGSAAAGAHEEPVLLVATDSVPAVVGAELARLKPKKIIVLGGTASVSDSVLNTLKNYAPVVTRLAGADRYAVSVAISRDTFTPAINVAYLASGAVFPDALAGSAVAASGGGPVLLTTKDSVPQATIDELARLKPHVITILGGTNTISPSVEALVKAIAPTTRIAGADRFEVAANLSADAHPTGADVVYVASGVVFPDALSGSPAAANNDAPVLLVTKDTIPTATAAELDRLNPAQIVVLGGPNTVSDAVYGQLQAYLR